jgi:hypothetical protein
MSVKLGLSHYGKNKDLGCLRRTFGPKREEVAGGWITLHNEELRNWYGSTNIVRVLRSTRMRWADM